MTTGIEGKPPDDLGLRLRHVRKIRMLQLKDIAGVAGCSESMLSKIETGKVNPTITLLRKLVDALGINVATLFSGWDEPDAVVHPAGTRPMIHVGGSGKRPGVVLERLLPFRDGCFLEANIHRVMPGGSSDGPFSHVGEEMGYVLSGSLTLTVDGTTYQLHEGDSFSFRSEQPHEYRNDGPVPARILWVNTPPTF